METTMAAMKNGFRINLMSLKCLTLGSFKVKPFYLLKTKMRILS